MQASIGMVLDVLEEQGAGLGRPSIDTLKGFASKNLKELRVKHDGSPDRILFAFDPQRQAAGLTQEELAELLAVRQSYIWQVEGRENITLGTLIGAIAAMGGSIGIVPGRTVDLGGRTCVLVHSCCC